MRRTVALLAAVLLFAASAAGCLADEKAPTLKDHTLKYLGKTYTVPISYRDFIAAGWRSAQVKADDTLPATSRRSVVTFRLGSMSCFVDLINWDISSREVRDCYISSLSFTCRQAGLFVLPGGIDFAVSTRDDVVRAFGKPSRESGYSVTYGGYDSYWTFGFDTVSGLLKEAKVADTSRPAAFVNAPLPDEEPDDVGAFIARQTALSDDFTLLTFSLEGAVYRLPVQVKQLISDGWTLESARDEYVGGGDASSVTLKRGENKKTFSVKNYSERAARPEFCFITELSFGGADRAFSVELGGGISVGSALEDLLPLLPAGTAPDMEKRICSFYCRYGNSGYNYAYYSFIFDENGVILSFRVDYSQGRSFLEEFVAYYNAAANAE